MSYAVILSFVLIFVPIFVAKFIMEKALKKLDAETKLKLVDGFSNQRKYGGLIMLPLVLIYFLVLKSMPQYTMQTLAGFGLMFFIYYAISRTMTYRKMVALGLPVDYLRSYRVAVLLIAAGFVLVGIQVVCILYMH